MPSENINRGQNTARLTQDTAQPPVTPLPKAHEASFYLTPRAQLEQAMAHIDVAPHVRMILFEPRNELIVNFPVRLDSGAYHLFTGYRIQHNNMLGPYKE